MISIFSRLLATLLTVLCASSAVATPVTGADLYTKVRAAAAKAGHAADPQIDPSKVYYPCGSDLKITPLFANWQTVRVICLAPTEWEIVLRTRVTPALEDDVLVDGQDNEVLAVTLVRPLRRGERVTHDDVVLQPVSRRAAFDSFRRIEDTVGRKLVQSVQTGSLLRLRHLAKTWAIEEGAAVTMELKRGTVLLVGLAVAMEPGQVGDVIHVRNPASNTLLRARVDSEKKVTVLAKIR